MMGQNVIASLYSKKAGTEDNLDSDGRTPDVEAVVRMRKPAWMDDTRVNKCPWTTDTAADCITNFAS